jgi:inosine-uridine nucleoside N-ribohydrolase
MNCECCSNEMTAMNKRKLIIDCDPGTDDAQAILMALADKDTEVVAITVVVGNTSVDNATRNVLRLLKYFNFTDVSFLSAD